MLCMNQCDYPGEDGKPCRCAQDAINAFDQKLKAAVTAKLGGFGAMSPELYAVALQDIADAVGCVVNDNFRGKVREILRDLPCPLD